MSDEFIQNVVLFKHIESYARSYWLIRARYLEEEKRLLLALQNYGAIAEDDMETIGENDLQTHEIIRTALKDTERINRDASIA
jgi:hypothetical protein